MADRKISDLTALTTPATGDLLPIVDVSEAAAADKNKSITVQELFKGVPDGTAAAPGLAFESDDGNGIYKPGTDQVAISTGGTGRLFVDSDGDIGIGTTSPSQSWTGGSARTQQLSGASGQITVFRINEPGATYGDLQLISTGSAETAIYNFANGAMRFGTNGSERLRIDSSGRLLVGTSTARGNINSGAKTLQIETAVNNVSTGLSVVNNSSTGWTSRIALGMTGGTAVGSNTIVSSGNSLGALSWVGADGTNLIEAGRIQTQVDGTPGTNDMPGRLVFSTTADGASSPTERMRISSDGTVFVAKTAYGLSTAGHELQSNGVAYHTSSTARVIIANKLGADGILVGFYHDTTEEGNISVSGSTVSYNGAHLSRWSQLAGNAERIEILRGSVLSNIDEMCEWGEEDNEQLNRMQVSNVEGDRNVAGVFQAWDDDDDTYTNDFYCAMTGDFIIRIAQGVTVERGDLLMSAGDGTAKPQEDDIIRSKTIAKVTSTNVSCTYDDGSYCVPCVLMAC